MANSENNPRDPGNGRFRPGRSGNPKGRPKKPKTVGAAITSAFNEKVQINEGGRRRRITKLEAAAKQIANKSASGDPKVTKLGLDLIQKTEERKTGATAAATTLSETDQQIADRLVARIQMILATKVDQKKDSTGD